MDWQSLFEMACAAMFAVPVIIWLNRLNGRKGEQWFRLFASLAAVTFIAVAGVAHRTDVFEPVFGSSPIFIPATLLALAVACINAAVTIRTEVPQEARFGEAGRSVLSALPLAPEWNDQILGHVLSLARAHFSLTADQVITEVVHRPGAEPGDASHTLYSYQARFKFRGGQRRTIRLAVEIVPDVFGPEQRRRFSSLVPEASRLAEYPGITLLPLCGDAAAAERQMRTVSVQLRAWAGLHAQERIVQPTSDSTITFAAAAGTTSMRSCRRWLFETVLDGPNSEIEILVDNLLHHTRVPTIYFQPEVIATKQWTFRASASAGVRLSNAALYDCQIPVEGHIASSGSQVELELRGRAISVDGRVLETPVMPWSTVQYSVFPVQGPAGPTGGHGAVEMPPSSA